ncbi:MAG: NADH-quinone oxidoreductase subunit NuoE [Defluviitaleaceae bacterium]|nr:NADH-quinone oxidoreductase subunit NuoE [Defluviitaleaceae bacterium]
MNLELLQPVFESVGRNEGALISVLQQAQDIYGYLPIEVLEYIAQNMGLTTAKVLGVTTFYAQFRTKPVGKHLIMLCQGTACHVNGSGMIEEIIKEHLQIEEGDISADGLFTYNNVACLGCCSLAPAMMIGDKVYGNLDKDKTVDALNAIKRGEGS